jgi:RNA polymerase sigma-32 factor
MNVSTQADSLRAYRHSLAHVKLLDRDAERDAAARWKAGDARAGEELIRACLPFVMSIALEYRRWGVPLEDVVQQGNIGLLRAAKKFDLDRECRLATYAAYWIRAEIREYVVRAFRVVRLGTTKAERRALRAYRASRDATPQDLARASGLSEERIEKLLPCIAAHEVSLDGAPASGRALDPTRGGPSPEEEVSTAESAARDREAVTFALGSLDERERLIVRERMMADDPPTLQELGSRLGVSKERVRQLEERAKVKLRARLTLSHGLLDVADGPSHPAFAKAG